MAGQHDSTISDRTMLRAAERALVTHLRTRPATSVEAARIAEDFRARETDLRARARALRDLRAPTAAERGRGPDAPIRAHIAGVAVCRALRDAGRLEQEAAREASRAEAWEHVARLPEGRAWEETRAEYQARVDYYAGLVATGEARS